MGDRPCGDELGSLVQAVKDHARTTRRLAEVTAERDAALAKIARVHALVDRWSNEAIERGELDDTIYTSGAVDMLRGALADTEGGN